MKKYYYAVQDAKRAAHVLTVREGENVAAKIDALGLVVVHPCRTYAEAVKIAEAWKAAQQ